MNFRPYNAVIDYASLVLWASQYQEVPPSSSWLPTSGGIVVDLEDGTPAAMCFLYETKSKIALIEWVYGNPEIEGFQRDRAIDRLFELVIKYAELQGIELLVGSVINPRLLERAPKHGFNVEPGAVTVTRRVG